MNRQFTYLTKLGRKKKKRNPSIWVLLQNQQLPLCICLSFPLTELWYYPLSTIFAALEVVVTRHLSTIDHTCTAQRSNFTEFTLGDGRHHHHHHHDADESGVSGLYL
jgi:hypothetical protein